MFNWLKEWAREGDLLASALTGVQPAPERRARQIFRRLATLRREEDALSNELSRLTHK
jgi:hypothetical protein